jgi:cation transport regulator ChaB
MPDSGQQDLPANIKKLPEAAQKQWLAAFNAAFKGYKAKNEGAQGRESYAFRVANAAVKARNEGRVTVNPAVVSLPITSVLTKDIFEWHPEGRFCRWCGSAKGSGHRHAARAGDPTDAASTLQVKEVMAGSATVDTLIRQALAEATEDHPFSIIQRGVSDALDDACKAKLGIFAPEMNGMGMNGGPGEYRPTPWVVELYIDRAIVSYDGKLWAIPYTWDDDEMEAELDLANVDQVKVQYVTVPGEAPGEEGAED